MISLPSFQILHTKRFFFVLPTWQASTPIINPSFLVQAATNFSPAFSPWCQPKGATNIRSRSSAASIKPCRAHLRHRVGRSLSHIPPSFRILLLILRLPKFGNEKQSNNQPFHTKHNPLGSMHGIFTYIYHKNQPNLGKYQPNVGKYTIHTCCGNNQ